MNIIYYDKVRIASNFRASASITTTGSLVVLTAPPGCRLDRVRIL